MGVVVAYDDKVLKCAKKEIHALLNEQHRLCMVLELCGKCLENFLSKQTEALSMDTCLSICQDIAEGLTYVHEMGMFHGDMKSKNVLQDGFQQWMLCDFVLSHTTTTLNS